MLTLRQPWATLVATGLQSWIGADQGRLSSEDLLYRGDVAVCSSRLDLDLKGLNQLCYKLGRSLDVMIVRRALRDEKSRSPTS